MLGAVLDGVFLVFERDFIVLANGLVDFQHCAHNVLICGLVSAHQIDLVLQFLNLVVAA